MNDQILSDMWNSEQCGAYAYRTHRRQVSAWLNNLWMRVSRPVGSTAPWTWTKGDPR